MFYKVGVFVFQTTIQVLMLLGSDFYRDENHNESSKHERKNQTLHGSAKLKSQTISFELNLQENPFAQGNHAVFKMQ